MKAIALCLSLSILLRATSDAQVVFPVKSSDNSRYLVDNNNKPFPILGRTAWFIISQPVSGYTHFIENTLSHGFNSIEMASICHWPMGNHAPQNGNGDIPFVKQLDGATWTGNLVYKDTLKESPDLTTPNEKYWNFVDSFLKYCDSKGILVFFFPAYVGFANSDQGWMQELVANGPEKVKWYGAWIAERYKNQKNLVWMLLGDQGKFKPKEIIAEAALIEGLKSVKGQQSIHYTAESESGQNARDQEDFGHEMTINGVYTWDSIGLPHIGRRAYSQTPPMPSFLLEEPYDEEGPDGNKYNPHAIQPVRRFEWWGWLTTTGGYIAGNGYVWPFIDPVWQQHLNTQAANDMQRLNRFIRAIPWWDLVPSGLDGMKNLVTAGEGNDSLTNFVAAAATKNGKLLIAYIPPDHRGSITIDLSALQNKITARWYDPSEGSYKKIKGSPFANSGEKEFTPPGKNNKGDHDWVLVLTAK